MINIIKSCIFLWNYGLLCGDNKGYMPDDYVVEDQDELDARIAASAGGRIVRDIVCDYLFAHKWTCTKNLFLKAFIKCQQHKLYHKVENKRIYLLYRDI